MTDSPRANLPPAVDPQVHLVAGRPVFALVDAAVIGAWFVATGFSILALEERLLSKLIESGSRTLAVSCLLGLWCLPLVAEALWGWRPVTVLGAVVRDASGARARPGQLLMRFGCKWAWLVVTLLFTIVFGFDRRWPGFMQFGVTMYLMFVVLGVCLSPLGGRRTWYDHMSGTAVFELARLNELQRRGFEVVSEAPAEEVPACDSPDQSRPT
jgi:hypothetical protein